MIFIKTNIQKYKSASSNIKIDVYDVYDCISKKGFNSRHSCSSGELDTDRMSFAKDSNYQGFIGTRCKNFTKDNLTSRQLMGYVYFRPLGKIPIKYHERC